MAKGVSGTALAALAAGAVFLYSGVKGKSITTALQSVIQGKSPAGAPQANAITGTSSADLATLGVTSTGTAIPGGGSGAPGGSGGSGAVASGSAGAAQAYAQSQLSRYGWGMDQWPYLKELWDRESGWSNTIWNGGSHAPTLPGGSSGAYGIAQSLPYSKYPKAGWPPGYGGSADAQAQVNWGLQYIRGRYITPQGAWNHEVANNWY